MLIDIFNIPPPMTWKTDQVANIINILSAIGTVGSLIFLIIQERRNSKKIDNLGNVVQELKEQTNLQRIALKNQVRPKLKMIGTLACEDGSMEIRLENIGQRVNIENIHFPNSEVGFLPPFKYEVDTGEELTFKCVSKSSKHVAECSYTIELLYQDALGNPYNTLIKGVGQDIKKFDTIDFTAVHIKS